MNSDYKIKQQHKSQLLNRNFAPAMSDEEYQTQSQTDDISNIVAHDQPLHPQNVIAIQNQLGNQATINILNRKKSDAKPTKSVNPFAGLKMVMPSSIQREPNDTDDDTASGGNEQDDDSDEAAPEQILEENGLDGSDNEVQEQDSEIDQIKTEAQGGQSDAKNTGDDEPDNELPFAEDGRNKGVSANALDVAVNDDDDDTDSDTDSDDDIQNDYWKENKGKTLVSSKTPKPSIKTFNKKIGGRDMSFGIGNDLSLTKEATKNVAKDADVLLNAVSAGKMIKDGIDANADMADAGSESASGGLSAFSDAVDVPPFSMILPVASLIYRIYQVVTKRTHMKAYKALANRAAASKADFKEAKNRDANLNTSNALLGAYAYNKTRRGFWLRVSKAVILAAQIISRLVTFFSGGTAAIVSEAVDLGLALTNGAIKIGNALKGLFKVFTGTRGKRRSKVSNLLLNSAMDGDLTMLKTLVDSNVLSRGWMMKRINDFEGVAGSKNVPNLNDLQILANRPKNEHEMLLYIQAANRQNLYKALKMEIAETMKST